MAKSQQPLSGKLVLITGATSGTGEAAATQVAADGAAIVAVVRDRRRGEQTVARIRAATGNEQLELWSEISRYRPRCAVSPVSSRVATTAWTC